MQRGWEGALKGPGGGSGQAVTRGELLEDVWGLRADTNTRVYGFAFVASARQLSELSFPLPAGTPVSRRRASMYPLFAPETSQPASTARRSSANGRK